MTSNNDAEYRKTLSGKIQNALLNARQHGGLERAEAVLSSRAVGLEGELLDEAVQTAGRVAELAREGDHRGATDLAFGTATQLADKAEAPEAPQLTRDEVLRRVRGHRPSRVARVRAGGTVDPRK